MEREMVSKQILESRINELNAQISASTISLNNKENDIKQHMANHNALLGAKMITEEFLNNEEHVVDEASQA
jgi:hypothetical protein